MAEMVEDVVEDVVVQPRIEGTLYQELIQIIVCVFYNGM